MIGGILGPLRVEKLDDGKHWMVLESFRYYLVWPAPDVDPEFVDVPAGFVTDFGSIPLIVPPLFVDRVGKMGKAFVIHDKLYRAPVIRLGDRTAVPIDRGQCDRIMRDVGEATKAPWRERQLSYAGVRMGGFVPWNRYRNEEREIGHAGV